MDGLRQTTRETHSPPRWSLLIVSALVSFLLLSVSLVGAKQMAPDAAASGVVVDPFGFPPGDDTTVNMYVLDEWGECCEWYTQTLAYSDTGSFSFDLTVIPPYLLGEGFSFVAEAPWNSSYFDSLPVSTIITTTSAPIDTGNLTLTFASFAGMVYEPEGIGPMDGGWVGVNAELPDGDWIEVASGDYYSDGYAIGAVPTGSFDLVAYPPKDSTFWDSGPTWVTVTEGSQYDWLSTQAISLYLQYPNVTGQAVYPDGSPATWIYSGTDEIGWAAARAEKWDFSVDIDRPTNSAGEFGLLLPSGDYNMWTEPEALMVMTYTQSLPRLYSVPTHTDLIIWEPFTLTYPSVRGLVEDPLGSPVTECLSVWLEDMYEEWAAVDWYCPPDGPPYYRLGGAPAGDYWLMSDGLPDWGLFPPAPQLVHIAPDSQYDPDGTQDMAITLTGPQLQVYVEGPLGSPVPATVVLGTDWGEVGQAPRMPPDPARFGGLEPGEYWIQAWPTGPDIPALANSRKEFVLIGTEPITKVLRLRQPDVVGVIETPEGDSLPQAYDGEGNPVPHPAEVHVHNPDWSVDLWATTNVTGEFSLALPIGDYNLAAYPMWDLVDAYTKSELQSFELQLLDPRPLDLGYIALSYPRIVGVVETPDGRRVSTSVNLWNESGYWDDDDTLWYPPDEDKLFRFGGMPDGHYFVQADPPWHNPEGFGSSNVYEFDVPPTPTTHITLVLGMANILGDVRFPPDDDCPEGCPVWPWVDVRVRTEDWEHERWMGSGDAGEFAFTWPITQPSVLEVFLPPELWVDWDPPAPYPFTLDTTEHQITPTLFLRPALRTKRLIGEVRDQDGYPVDDGLVYAFHEDSGQYANTLTDFDGNYDMWLDGGLWWVGVEPTHSYADWYFDPGWEQTVWFPITPTLPVTETVFLTVTRFTAGDFLTVTGTITTPNAALIAPDTVWVDLCNDKGLCFGAPAATNGDFMIYALPGAYDFWIDVDPATNLLPPLENDFPVFLDGPEHLGLFYLRAIGDRTARVSGRVIVSPTLTGLASVPIEGWTDEGDWNTATTNKDGNYVLNLFPGQWHGGPALWLSPTLAGKYTVLPPDLKHGHLGSGETISSVNFFVRRLDATIRGKVVISGTTTPITDVQAIVLAERCAQDGRCWTFGEDEVQGGSFELKVLGGFAYKLRIWVTGEGYMPGPPPALVPIITGETVTGVRIGVIEAGTKIHGYLLDGNLEPVEIEASVFGNDSEGKYWVEDFMWPGKEPHKYNLYVPTPDSTPITWTLGLWVDPSSGYIADPAHPNYPVVVNPGQTTVPQIMYVQKLDTVISGTVSVGVATADRMASALAPAPYVWVFAEGVPGTGSEGLYFEAQTGGSGAFSMFVLPGQYMVSAYPPPELARTHFPPLPAEWDVMDDNPVDLVLRLKPTGTEAINICGDLSVSPAGSLSDDTEISVFGWAEDGSYAEITGTLVSGYCLGVIPDSVWYVWAAYEDTANDAFYHSLEKRVSVGSATVNGVNLTLAKSPYELPDGICETFDPSVNKRISLPAREDLFEPLIEIPAGSMPVTGRVELCATPKIAVQGGENLLGFGYELEARDSQGNLITQSFNKKVRLTFYLNADLVGDAQASEITLAYYSTVRQEWIALDDPYVDLDDYFATGKIDHFTMFGSLSTAPTQHDIYLPLLIRNSS